MCPNSTLFGDRYLQKLMADGGQMGGRMRHKLKGDLQSNNFGSGKHVSILPIQAQSMSD